MPIVLQRISASMPIVNHMIVVYSMHQGINDMPQWEGHHIALHHNEDQL